jgi:peptidoglycan/xylan/chitin deacetylase (PgdA/CDA1 family)
MRTMAHGGTAALGVALFLAGTVATAAMSETPVVRTESGPVSGAVDELLGRFGPDKERALAAYDPEQTGDKSEIGIRIVSDQAMVEPARLMARLAAAAGQPTYAYRFSYVASSIRKHAKGALHATEIPFAFETARAKYGDATTAEDEAIAAAMNAYWVSFARTGDPNGDGRPKWPAYAETSDVVMDFTIQGPVAGPDPLRARLDVIERRASSGAPEGAQGPPPRELTAEQDHQRLMDLLGIQSIRPGADPRNPQAPNAANYDEAKANPYPGLPDPLVLKNGKRVTSAKMWWEARRPEIVEDFDREVYGRVPRLTPKVTWEVTGTAPDTVGGIPVITKTLTGHVDNSKYPAISVDIEMSLTTPADAAGPVPIMLELGFRFPGGGASPPRPPSAASEGPTWQEQLVSKGWGYAILYPNTIQADNGAGLTRGIIGLVNEGRPRGLDDWGALRAWAWGASRALDYFETDRAVNARQVGIEGLSRYGKAALVAMAYDARFAIAFVASSGEGGAKLHRRRFGELVENVAGAGEYHWMAGNFIKYAGPLTANDLPVDSHELIALCAPRPVFISSGSFEVEGGWVDQKGMFLAAVGAGPVYRLLGKRDLGATEFPPLETALIAGDIAFRQHRGGHTAGPNWPTFLTFAERYIKAPPIKAPAPDVQATPGARPKVALTFDDLPAHAALPPGVSRADIASSILSALKAHHAPPTYGFVNGKGLDDDPANAEVLRLWRAAGHPLGNHTFSHMDLHANTPEAFEQDVVANEATLRKYMGDEGWRFLRFPYLHEGETLEKRRAVARFLMDRGYTVAQVTLNFDDWTYNDPYARCVAKDDPPAIEWMKESYIRRAAESLSAGRENAERAYGRDIAHVMLLHVGALQTVMLPRLLELLEGRGYELVTLQEAQSDPAYRAAPDRSFPSGATLLEQVMAAKGIPAPVISDDTLSRLAGLCR